MRIIDKVVFDEKVEDVDDREDLIIQCCVEEYGYKGDKELCESAKKLPYTIDNLQICNETCIECWCREVKETEVV